MRSCSTCAGAHPATVRCFVVLCPRCALRLLTLGKEFRSCWLLCPCYFNPYCCPVCNQGAAAARRLPGRSTPRFPSVTESTCCLAPLPIRRPGSGLCEACGGSCAAAVAQPPRRHGPCRKRARDAPRTSLRGPSRLCGERCWCPWPALPDWRAPPAILFHAIHRPCFNSWGARV